MSLKRLLVRRLYPAAIASLYFCSLLFILPGILRPLDRPGARLAKMTVVRGAMQFAIADFDGDRQPDLATIRVIRNSPRAAEYLLELQLSSGTRPGIGILGPTGGLQITSQDVNGDKIADLVVTSVFDTQFVAILLNDGKGNFKQVERSDYPEVGKRTGSRLVGPSDAAAFQLTLGLRGSTESDGVARAAWDSPIENFAQLLPSTAPSARTFLALAAAGRAPPLV